MSSVLLSVNVDHVATLRQARRTPYPDPVEAARLAEEVGAGGITVHLRLDRRHIQEDDVRRLRESVRGKLNLELAAEREMIDLALETRPHQVTLVPERPEELTTEGGLDLSSRAEQTRAAAEALREGGIAVSLFLDPDLAQVEALAAFSGLVSGFEINTDAYTRAGESERRAELEKIARTARQGSEAGFRVYAGHGLTVDNVGPVAAVPEVEELNIGHALVSRAVLVGMRAAVAHMLRAIDAATTTHH